MCFFGADFLPASVARARAPLKHALHTHIRPQAFAKLVQPAFDARKHVGLASSWAVAQREVVRLACDALNGADLAKLQPEFERLRAFHAEPRVTRTALWYAGLAKRQGKAALAGLLASLAQPTRPLAYAGQVALVTGAGPGSIASAMVERLLAGGCRVVLTTSGYDTDRILGFRRLWQAHAAPGAELHVLPFNQASTQDLDALTAWLVDHDLLPDLVAPFGALKDLGTLDRLSPKAEAALRAMLLNVERLVAALGRQWLGRKDGRRCHVILPMSPNLGQFGGDGFYAEGKAGMFAILQRWRSEGAAWGQGTSLVAAKIGWVRGTGLMNVNNAIAPGLESSAGVRTFAAAEMGLLLGACCTDAVRSLAEGGPLVGDFTGGMGQVTDLRWH